MSLKKGTINIGTIIKGGNSSVSAEDRIILYYEGIIFIPSSSGNYDLFYADSNGNKLNDYDAICSFNNVTPGQEVFYSYLNKLNVAPLEARKIIAVNKSNDNVVAQINLNNQLDLVSKNIGTKNYSAAVFSDVHIDGNGDGNNSDNANSCSDFENALDYANEYGIDLVTICGDITYYGYTEDYQQFNSIIANKVPNIPVKTARGNHELYEGSSNYNSDSTRYTTYIGDVYYQYTFNNDIYLFLGNTSDSASRNFSDDELNWLEEKLETYRNQRVFLFTHYYYGETGNINGISTHSPLTREKFIELIKHYKNVIYFSGHTHLDYRLQMYGANANIKYRDETCHRVHIPSLAKPRISADGGVGSAQLYAPGTEGYIMDVYDNGIVLKGIDFEIGKILPIATYYLDTTPITIEGNSSSSTITPLMELGEISKTGVLSDSSSYCRTKDYVDVSNYTTLIFNNSGTGSTRVFCYDENKTFMTDWHQDSGGTKYSYRQMSNGVRFDVPEGCKFIKARFTADGTNTLTILGE